jgi:hypothetical protein
MRAAGCKAALMLLSFFGWRGLNLDVSPSKHAGTGYPATLIFNEQRRAILARGPTNKIVAQLSAECDQLIVFDEFIGLSRVHFSSACYCLNQLTPV